MDEDVGVRWLTLSKEAIADKEQYNQQHREDLYSVGIDLEAG